MNVQLVADGGDPIEIVNCGQPLTGENPFIGTEDLNPQFPNLPPGTYTFTVRAFVTLGGDEFPTFGNTVTLTWTIEEPIEVETSLTAVDGNGVTITNGDSTTSNEIEFTLTGTYNC